MRTKLFSPYQIGGMELQNRISVPPMCMYQATDGMPNVWHNVHYGKLAQSGAALVCVEATAVCPEGRITPYDLGLWTNDQCDAMREMVSTMRHIDDKTKVIVQLSHAGRKGSCALGGKNLNPEDGGWELAAPSAIALSPAHRTPHEMTKAEIDKLIEVFSIAAFRAQQAGFDGIELHCAHGYLMHEFLSPLTNHRTDEFGGSLENRMRLPLMVFVAIKEAAPQLTVGVRVSATDWVEGGWSVEETIAFVKELQRYGCEFVDVSAGGLSPDQKIDVQYGYQLPYARAVKEATGMSTLCCGLIKYAAQAETILVQETADMVDIGRAMLLNPHWGWQAALELGDESVVFPHSYARGMHL